MLRITAKEISDRLANQIELVCRHLLPNGKKQGREWCVGSPDGEAGHSCKVQLSGDRAGLWADFAGNESGDALDLWARAKGVSLSEAMSEAKRWLGIAEPTEARKAYDRPKPGAARKLTEKGPVHKYLTNDRCLKPDILAAYKVTEHKKAPGYYLPYFSPKGELMNLKWIGLERKRGKKEVITGKNCAPILFGWQAIPRQGRSILICEGEIDAMSWCQMGFPALSVPYGAKNLDWIDLEWENLEPYDEIYLSFDMDDAGRQIVKEIAKRLGLHRCKIIELPFKDANEWLCEQSPEEDDMYKVLGQATHIVPNQFVDVVKYSSLAFRVLQNINEGGFEPQLFKPQLAFRPHETTIWTGYPGHGKSTILSHLMLEAAVNEHKVVIASMEMPLHRQIAIMCRQFLCKEEINEDEIVKFTNWMSGRIYLLDVYGMVSHKQIMELMEYAAKRHGCDVAVIDSLMKLEMASDDYEMQRKITNEFTCFAQSNAMHLHIVAHPRKGQKESYVGMLDVKGSQDVIAQPDNVLAVQRNKSKEKKLSRGRTVEGHDAMIVCDKQRATGHVFELPVRWHPDALQYTQDTELARVNNYAYVIRREEEESEVD